MTKMTPIKKFFLSKICSGYPYKFVSRYANVGRVLFFMTGIAYLIQCRARSLHVSSTILFILFYYLYFRLKIPIFPFAILYSVNLCILFQVFSVTFSFADFPNAIAFSRVKFDSLTFLSLNKSSITPIIIIIIIREFLSFLNPKSLDKSLNENLKWIWLNIVNIKEIKKRTRWAIVNEMNEEHHGRRNEWDAEKVVR